MAKQLKFNIDARDRLKAGVDILAEAVNDAAHLVGLLFAEDR